MFDSEIAEVADSLERLAGWMRRQAPSKVSLSAYATLDTLATAGPLRISELAQRESLTQPGMTTLVNRLEAAGQAERFADPTDGRAALVRITDAGRAVIAQRRADRAEAVRARIEHLNEVDSAAVRAAARVLNRFLADSDQAEPDVPPVGAAAAPPGR